MLLCGSSDLNTVLKVAGGVAVSGANMFIARDAHCFNLYELPTPQALLERLDVLKQDKKEIFAIWVSGKQTK